MGTAWAALVSHVVDQLDRDVGRGLDARRRRLAKNRSDIHVHAEFGVHRYSPGIKGLGVRRQIRRVDRVFGYDWGGVRHSS